MIHRGFANRSDMVMEHLLQAPILVFVFMATAFALTVGILGITDNMKA
jgi:hypothetical protein